MKLPPGTEARLGLIPQAGYFVFLAVPPLTAGSHLLAQLEKPGSLTALITHDPGMDWTDRKGELLAEGVLHQGGAVVMRFETMADALGAQRRLVRELEHQACPEK